MDSEKTRSGWLSRRAVVKRSAGAAVAGAGLVAAGAGPAAADAKARPARTVGATDTAHEYRPTSPASAHRTDEVVVHVRNAREGLLDVYVGERHIEVRDQQLADRLVAAIGR